MGCGEHCKLLLRDVAIAFPLNTMTNGSTVPSPAIVTTTATRFVSFVNVRMWMVFFPMSSSVRLQFIKK
jgi:hypothetical protein